MPVATIDALAAALPGLTLLNCYGATETTSPATMMPMGETRAHADSVGVALPTAEVRVMDDAGREVAPGDTGELWIAGPMVVPGYWANPQATAASFTAGWWHSGDLGSVDAQGYVRVFDRKKDMLNRGGFKIYSVEVENVLMAWPGMVEAAVVGRPCPVLGERVHAFVHAPGVRADDAALRALLRRAAGRLQGAGDLHLERRAAAAQRQRQADEAAAARSPHRHGVMRTQNRHLIGRRPPRRRAWSTAGHVGSSPRS